MLVQIPNKIPAPFELFGRMLLHHTLALVLGFGVRLIAYFIDSHSHVLSSESFPFSSITLSVVDLSRFPFLQFC